MKNLKILLILIIIIPSISFAQRGGKKGFGNYGAKKQTSYFKGKINVSTGLMHLPYYPHCSKSLNMEVSPLRD